MHSQWWSYIAYPRFLLILVLDSTLNLKAKRAPSRRSQSPLRHYDGNRFKKATAGRASISVCVH